MKQFDVDRLFLRQTRQPASNAERWAELFAARDRDGLILQALVYIRKYNSATPDFIKPDVEMYAVQRAIVAVDRCLQENKQPEKASAYIRASVIHAISNARKGKVTKYVATNVRTTQPRKTNRELETKLRQSGLSNAMVEAELFSHGYQPCSRVRVVESEWPEWTSKDGGKRLADFAGNSTGKRRHSGTKRGMQMLESAGTSDDWEFLTEILSDEQLDYLRLRAAGYTQGEIEDEFKVSAAEQSKIMRDIKTKIQAHE
jgi:hypothetical protein